MWSIFGQAVASREEALIIHALQSGFRAAYDRRQCGQCWSERNFVEQTSLGRLKGLRVLVVDDHRDSADSLAMLMLAAGCQSRVAYDGSHACELFDQFEPQIVILDLLMPAPDGYEVARQITTRTHGSPPILVALSGYSHDDREQKRRLDDAGFDFCFLKPANIRELFATLAWAVIERSGEGRFAEAQPA
jgi:DNA-binding response OmpR family regulator